VDDLLQGIDFDLRHDVLAQTYRVLDYTELVIDYIRVHLNIIQLL